PKIWCAEQIDKLRERWVYGGKREKGYHSDVYNNEKIYWGRKRKSTNGYIAQNKPKYLPEDTVKVKAYLTNHKGKPLSKEIDFFIKDYMNDTIIQEKIKPVSSGNYQYEFVLGDSLEIDRNYEFIFKPKNKFAKEKSFRLEDYELGDVEFDFTVSKSNYEKDEEVKFSANAKYTNGRRAAARIRISLTTTFVEEYLLDTMFVKEVLWTYEEDLDFEDETEIIIPDSILPQADMRMKATAELFTADGELEVFERSFRINSEASLAAEGKLVMESENGFLKADYIINNKSVSKDAVLSRISNFNTNIQKIKLPYSEKINPFYSSFEIETDNDWDELDEYELGEAKINSFGKRG
ncbi:MAG: hypothetical protein ACPG5P_09120, partial [Saprospiraceae bacterium]